MFTEFLHILLSEFFCSLFMDVLWNSVMVPDSFLRTPYFKSLSNFSVKFLFMELQFKYSEVYTSEIYSLNFLLLFFFFYFYYVYWYNNG